jgi:antitoxin component of RelBE/YafQ-DinJ toxin-antitoxin module
MQDQSFLPDRCFVRLGFSSLGDLASRSPIAKNVLDADGWTQDRVVKMMTSLTYKNGGIPAPLRRPGLGSAMMDRLGNRVQAGDRARVRHNRRDAT